MNRSGVALAADSAVTVSFPERGDGLDRTPKIYTANKLFMLSKYEPIGIMINGSASILGIPWELIIKEYRRQLGETSFPRVLEYCNDFVHHLNNNLEYFPKELQASYFAQSLVEHLSDVLVNVNDDLTQLVKDGHIADEAAFEKATEERLISHLKDHVAEIGALADSNCIDIDETRFFNDYEIAIDGAQDRLLEMVGGTIQSTKDLRDVLNSLAYFVATKETLGSTSVESGVVIAGYGSSEIYPSLIALGVEGVIDNHLKYEIVNRREESRNALIVPFAQADMIHMFMEGVSPEYRRLVESYLEKVFRDKLPQIADTLIGEFRQHAAAAARQYGSQPILDAVEMLPVHELASMAETLVNLTSFRRRVTPDQETVGGPVDVAVITKGDGFIWIQRKHYFDVEKNPHFLTNYYRG